jgi:hypothetical protein
VGDEFLATSVSPGFQSATNPDNPCQFIDHCPDGPSLIYDFGMWFAKSPVAEVTNHELPPMAAEGQSID